MKEYLTVTEAREALGVSRWRMSEWVRRGMIAFVASPYDGRVKLIPRSEVERLKNAPRPSHEHAA